MSAGEDGMLIGGPSFLLPADVAPERWRGAGMFDWLFAVDAAAAGIEGVRAVKELGETRLHGVHCVVYSCDDGRVRAVPMAAREKKGAAR